MSLYLYVKRSFFLISSIFNSFFRKAKKVTKKPSKAAAASEATTPELEGLSYVSTGPGQGSGSGVYYVDFSDEYKTCLKRSRDEIEKETHLSILEKREAKWADEISKDRNLPIEDRLLQLKVSKFDNFQAGNDILAA